MLGKELQSTGITQKLGYPGIIISATGCASCFPLPGSLGAATGLGFLARYEGVLLNKLLPLFSIIALVNVLIVTLRL